MIKTFDKMSFSKYNYRVNLCLAVPLFVGILLIVRMVRAINRFDSEEQIIASLRTFDGWFQVPSTFTVFLIFRTILKSLSYDWLVFYCLK